MKKVIVAGRNHIFWGFYNILFFCLSAASNFFDVFHMRGSEAKAALVNSSSYTTSGCPITGSNTTSYLCTSNSYYYSGSCYLCPSNGLVAQRAYTRKSYSGCTGNQVSYKYIYSYYYNNSSDCYISAPNGSDSNGSYYYSNAVDGKCYYQ